MDNREILDEQNRRLVIATFLQRETDRYHHSYDEELLQYEYLRDGDPRAIHESIRLFRTGISGKLSEDPVRDKKYLFVASTTLATRFAIEGGMEAQSAYNLSDLYIQKMDMLKTVDEIYELHTAMITDFTEKLSNIRKNSSNAVVNSDNEDSSPVSKSVYLALDYIYYHLHEKITLEDIGRHVHMSPNYLNSLFKKEKGCTIQTYIKYKRIEAAKNMLLYSDYSESAISEFLAFSSTSYFIKTFREVTRLTPREYQKKNYRKHSRWKK